MSALVVLQTGGIAYRLILVRVVNNPGRWVELYLYDDEANVAKALLQLVEQRCILLVHEVDEGLVTAGTPTYARLKLIAGPGIRQRVDMTRFFFRFNQEAFKAMSLADVREIVDQVVEVLQEARRSPTRAVLLSITHVLALP